MPTSSLDPPAGPTGPGPMAALLREVRACTLCAEHLPHGVRPVLQAGARARLLVAGQAPGRRVHASGVPFDDPSGARLLEWLGIDRATFDDPHRVAVLPMGFCYPGTGERGDLPPRPECAPAWRERLLAAMPEVRLTVLLGQHALAWHLPGSRRTLTDAVRETFGAGLPVCVLPHPSPRNTPWLRRHPWFESEVLPDLRRRVQRALAVEAVE